MSAKQERHSHQLSQRTAYRQAAHAVMAIQLRIRFQYVTIRPDPTENGLGHLMLPRWPREFVPAFRVTPRTRDLIEAHIVCSLAGGLAEARLAGRPNRRNVERERPRGMGLAGFVMLEYCQGLDRNQEGRVLDRYVAYLWARAEGAVSSDQNWQDITLVAEELMAHPDGRLSATEVRRLIRRRH